MDHGPLFRKKGQLEGEKEGGREGEKGAREQGMSSISSLDMGMGSDRGIDNNTHRVYHLHRVASST